MKKLFLIAALILAFCPFSGLSQVATTGYHRTGQVLARAPQGGVTAQVVPYAKIAVTNTATGLAATIYSDPLLASQLTPPLLTANASGSYSYYIPLNYCVTETITSPGQGTQTISNICINGGGGTTVGIDYNGTPVVPTAGVYNFNATSPIVGTPSGNTITFSCPSCGTSSGGTSVSINGGLTLGNLNLNATTPSADSAFLALTPKISGSNAIIEAPYATTSTYGVTEALTLTTSGTSGPATLSGYTLNIPQYSGGGIGNPVTVVTRANPSGLSGTQQLYDPVASVTPWCDIRTQGAIINGSTPIDNAVQACDNLLYTLNGGTGTIFLPCIKAGGGAGCYWANPSSLTRTSSGNIKLMIQGGVQVGSTFVVNGVTNVFGDTSGEYGQFQTGSAPAFISGPNVAGTLGTVISAAGVQVTVTPTFTSGTIANTPPGSAITIAGTITSSAAASRAYPTSIYGFSIVTVTLASAIRIPPGEIFTMSGCSDSSFNVTNQAVQASDYTAQTLTFTQTSTTPATTTGCTVTGFNEDAFESAHLQCVNGVPYTAKGFSCPSGNTVGSNKWTFAVNHAHSSSDKWGAVAAGPEFNTYGPQTWDSLYISNCSGMCFWADGSTNLVMNHVGASASGTITSGAFELSSNYLSQFHDLFGQIATFPQGGCGGGVYASCSQPSYPYALRLDAQANGIDYNSGVGGCLSCEFDQGSVFVGGVKIDGSGGPVTGFSTFNSTMFEEVWGNAYTIDNRQAIQAETALSLTDQYLQDNVTQLAQYLVGYTDGNVNPSGIVQVQNNQPIDTGALVNPYFNGSLAVLGANAASRFIPLNNTAPSGVYNEGNLLAGEIENEGASFGPQIAPYGSLPMTSYSVSAWNALCVMTANCTITKVNGPDGPSGQMLAAEMSTSTTSVNILISTDTRVVYPGDHYIFWGWARPGSHTNQNYLAGIIDGNIVPAPFSLGAGFYFAPTSGTHSPTTNSCSPAGFGSGLILNGWAPIVGVCTATTGSGGSPTTVLFFLNASNGGTFYMWGNQIAEPGWAFIPGPNNPACTAAGTCNLTADQLEEARRDQYHGFVPPGVDVGTAVTGETVETYSNGPGNAEMQIVQGNNTYFADLLLKNGSSVWRVVNGGGGPLGLVNGAVGGSVLFSFSTTGVLTASGYVGPATAPSGSCSTNGEWVFSQDGHATVCLSSTWTTKI